MAALVDAAAATHSEAVEGSVATHNFRSLKSLSKWTRADALDQRRSAPLYPNLP